MKKIIFSVMSMSLLVLLAACGQTKLTTSKTTYHQNGLVAVVKGTTSKKADLSYQIGQAKQKKVKVKDGTYVIQIPATTTKQTVTLKAKTNGKTLTKKVTVAAAKALGSYAKVSQTYNQALVGMAMAKTDQQKAQNLAKQATLAKAGKLTPAQLLQLQKDQVAVQKATQQAQKVQKEKLLPTSAKTGVSQLVNHGNVTIRANVAGDSVLGIALTTSMKSMKNKSALKDFGTSFALLAQASGADSKKVLKQFTAFTKKNKKEGQTTIKTIKSNGVKFNTGFSTIDLYIYITK